MKFLRTGGVNGRVNSHLILIAIHLPDMPTQLQRFLKNESGAAAVEYGLLSSGIAVAIIPSVKDVGSKLVNIFTVLQHAV
jgi:pilus assembly protein Flp/PilA